jgi:hypothetical protein
VTFLTRRRAGWSCRRGGSRRWRWRSGGGRLLLLLLGKVRHTASPSLLVSLARCLVPAAGRALFNELPPAPRESAGFDWLGFAFARTRTTTFIASFGLLSLDASRTGSYARLALVLTPRVAEEARRMRCDVDEPNTTGWLRALARLGSRRKATPTYPSV